MSEHELLVFWMRCLRLSAYGVDVRWEIDASELPAPMVEVFNIHGSGCLDESVSPQNIDALERAWVDAKGVHADNLTNELFAARVRGIRPTAEFYSRFEGEGLEWWPRMKALLDACGPERTNE